MILEPVLDAGLMKVMFEIARKGHYTLLRCKLSKANATLILIGKTLRVPLYCEHFLKHLRSLTCLQAYELSPLNSLVEKVWDKTGKQSRPQDENDCRKGTDY